MADLLSYSLWYAGDRPGYHVDADGDDLPQGWYYQFPEAEPVGPFSTSGRAEFCAEAEIAAFEAALAAEDAITC